MYPTSVSTHHLFTTDSATTLDYHSIQLRWVAFLLPVRIYVLSDVDIDAAVAVSRCWKSQSPCMMDSSGLELAIRESFLVWGAKKQIAKMINELSSDLLQDETSQQGSNLLESCCHLK